MLNMTDSEIEERLQTLGIVKEFKSKIEELYKENGDIKKSIEEAIQYFDRRFDKGTSRMNKMDEEMKKGFEELHKSISQSNEERKHNHKQVMDKLDSEKDKRLMEQLRIRDEENAKLVREKELREKEEKQKKIEFRKRLLNVGERLAYLAIILLLARFGFNVPF